METEKKENLVNDVRLKVSEGRTSKVGSEQGQMFESGVELGCAGRSESC